ncbi:MAG: class I SAM-dependent methyltransferase [Vitreimonas sp.]
MTHNADARFWDRAARKYAASRIADTEGYERTLERTRSWLKTSDVVFEFGCGTGTTALKLAPSAARIVASDVSAEMIAIAREKAQAEGCTNVEFAVATPDAAPWGDAAFDAAMGFNILHLVAERDAALRGMHRLLKPGGVFISKTPCVGEMGVFIRLLVPLMRTLGQAPYVAFFTADELEGEIEAAGFEIVERGRHASRGKDRRPFLVARKR